MEDKKQIKETWVNLYKDKEGRFLGDVDFGDKDIALENRDELSTFLCVVRLTDLSIAEESSFERERTLNEAIEEFTFAKNVQKHKHLESHIQIMDIDTVIEILTKLKDAKQS